MEVCAEAGVELLDDVASGLLDSLCANATPDDIPKNDDELRVYTKT